MIKKPLKELDNRLLKIKSLDDLTDLLPQIIPFGYSLALGEMRDINENLIKSLKNKNTEYQLGILIDGAMNSVANICICLEDNKYFFFNYLGKDFNSGITLFDNYYDSLQDFKEGELTKDEFFDKYDFKNGANGGENLWQE